MCRVHYMLAAEGFHGDVLPILLAIGGVFIVGLVILAVLGWQESKDDFF